MSNKGVVYLVGAGPGDIGLLTIKGKELIETADVVVYDRLVGKKIMEIIPEGTEKINVGKNVGDHPVPQHEINKILLREALKGKKVVRLKGGDPFVFGRGGEELELLRDNDVEFQVIPGITSSISAPAYGGIPVTHRDFCSSLHIITGHKKADEELILDYEALVRLNGTLIFMMSVSNIGEIANGLKNAGMDGEMPCAIIENGTRSNQRTFVGKVSDIEEIAKANKVISPAVFMVGKVCQLSEGFDWFGKLKLKGKKILITQPEQSKSKLDKGLRALGADTDLYPTIRTKSIKIKDLTLKEKDVIVFTSKAGVKSFFKWLDENDMDVRDLHGMRFSVVGPGTGAALKEYGIKYDYMPKEYYGKTLGEGMVDDGFINKEDNVILLRGNISDNDIIKVFDNRGINYKNYVVYETEYIDGLPKVEKDHYDYITFTSKSCVDGFVKTQGKVDFGGYRALCIGHKTAELAEEFGFDTIVSDEATIDMMIKKLVESG